MSLTKKTWAVAERLDASDLNTQFTFGGDGSDGAFAEAAGTTTYDFSGAKVLIKQYSSFALTGTADIAVSNPHAEGSVLIILSQGNVTITSSASPAINLASAGGSGGAGGSFFAPNVNYYVGSGAGKGWLGSGAGQTVSVGNNGPDGAGGSGGGNATIGIKGTGLGSAAGSSVPGKPGSALQGLSAFSRLVYPGGGGAGGSGSPGAPGDNGHPGGRGGGGIYIECAGALNITGEIDVSGGAGENSADDGGAGGGGAGGSILILYSTLTDDSGTYTVTAGSGGTQGSTGEEGGAGSAGQSFVTANLFFP